MKKMMIGFLALVCFAPTGLFAGNDKGKAIKAQGKRSRAIKEGSMKSHQDKIKFYAKQIANEPQSEKNQERAEAIIEIVEVMG